MNSFVGSSCEPKVHRIITHTKYIAVFEYVFYWVGGGGVGMYLLFEVGPCGGQVGGALPQDVGLGAETVSLDVLLPV